MASIMMYVLLFLGSLTLIGLVRVEAANVAELKIEPLPAITDEKIKFTCSGPQDSGESGKYTFIVYKNDVTWLKYNHLCTANKQEELENKAGGPVNTNCGMLTYEKERAANELQGDYRCGIEITGLDFSTVVLDSNKIRLQVGDKTPDIKKFELYNLTGKTIVANNSELVAGTNLSITCETESSTPQPAITVTITGKETRTNKSVGPRVYFTEVVPRKPNVEFKCSVFNGFGVRKERVIKVISTYKARNEDIVMPDSLMAESGKEYKICSAANNPPRKLMIDGIDDGIIAVGYPKTTQANGMSELIVAFNSDQMQNIEELNVKCYFDGGAQSQRAIPLTSSTTANSVVVDKTNSAMMTIGIVVAALVLFLLVVAALAFICKKRDASKYSKTRTNNEEYDGQPPGKQPINVEANVA